MTELEQLAGRDPATMSLSPRGLAMIGRFEGFRSDPYNDVGGNATVGYGHLIHLGPVTAGDRRRWGGMTRSAGLELLEQDCATAVAGVRVLVRRPLGQDQFDALVSFAFNCGVGGLAHSTLLRDVNGRPGPSGALRITADFMRWDHAGGVVVPGLRARRAAEARLYLQGVYP